MIAHLPSASHHSPLRTTCHAEFHYVISAGPSFVNCIYSAKVLIWKSRYASSRSSLIMLYSQNNCSILHISVIMYKKIHGYRWMTTGDDSSLSPSVLSDCPHHPSERRHCFRLTLGQTGGLNSPVCTSIAFFWYGLVAHDGAC